MCLTAAAESISLSSVWYKPAAASCVHAACRDFLDIKRNQDIVVADNIVLNNSMPNPGSGDGVLSILPQGIGVMVMGSQRVNVTRNRIENHSQGGVFLADHDYGLHFVDIKDDPALINKAATNTTITNNRFSNNGYAPVNCCSMWSYDLYNDFVDFALWGKGTCFSGNSYTSAAVMYPPDFPEQARFMPDVQHYRASEFDSFQSYATACK
ncbi:hypothetical protein OEZ86_003121 [Tetradesmus obliquus]|nr:hypothetical protein OEZ86_003121 [Tetradesmus obliquus]